MLLDVVFVYVWVGFVKAEVLVKSPKFQRLAVAPNVLFKKLIVLDTHLGVSILKIASGLKYVFIGTIIESLHPLLFIAINLQLKV